MSNTLRYVTSPAIDSRVIRVSGDKVQTVVCASKKAASALAGELRAFCLPVAQHGDTLEVTQCLTYTEEEL